MKKSPTLSQIWCSKVRLRLHFAYILSEQRKGGVLHLDDPIETKNGQRKVRDIPLEKHPPCQPIYHDTIIIVMTPLMFTLSYSNLWMLMWLDLPHCTPVEQLDFLVSTYLDWMEKAMYLIQDSNRWALPFPCLGSKTPLYRTCWSSNHCTTHGQSPHCQLKRASPSCSFVPNEFQSLSPF